MPSWFGVDCTGFDDNARVAYPEIHDDETALTTIGGLRRATSWFACRGAIVERVRSDNGADKRVSRVARRM